MLKAQDVAIKKIEKQIKDSKASLKDKNSELVDKLQLKLGSEAKDSRSRARRLIQQVETQTCLTGSK